MRVQVFSACYDGLYRVGIVIAHRAGIDGTTAGPYLFGMPETAGEGMNGYKKTTDT